MPEPFNLRQQLKHGWNAFRNRDPTNPYQDNLGYSSSRRQDRVRLHVTNERSVIISVYNRIALDVAAVTNETMINTSRTKCYILTVS